MALHAVHTRKKKSVEWTTFDTSLRRVNFILMFFQEKVASYLSAEKPFSSNLEGLKVNIFVNHGDASWRHWL